MKKTIIFGIILLFVLSGCQSAQEREMRKLGFPEFSIQAIKFAKNCGCSIDDVTRKVECICENPSWEGKLKVVCLTPPSNEYEAMMNCIGTPIQ